MTDDQPNTTMTAETTRPEYRPTLGDLSHTHPDTDEAFGAAMAYKRGPIVAADGGERDSVDGDATGDEQENGADEADEEPRTEDDAGNERMRDVAHEPPDGDEVNRVHQRGGEGRSDR